MMVSKRKKILAIVICLYVLGIQFDSFAEEGGPIMVSLGDSYSSGEGIEPFYGQDQDVWMKVEDENWLAHRSQKSWPGQLTIDGINGTMAENMDHWYFRAVSGATTKNLKHKQKKSYSKDGYGGVKYLKTQLSVFDELGDKPVSYVTMTMGGNDVGFADIITQCLLHDVAYSKTNKLKTKFDKTWKNFYKKKGIREDIRKAYKEIEKKAGPQAHIIIAGYPVLLSNDVIGKMRSPEEMAEYQEKLVEENEEKVQQDTVNRINEAGINRNNDLEETIKRERVDLYFSEEAIQEMMTETNLSEDEIRELLLERIDNKVFYFDKGEVEEIKTNVDLFNREIEALVGECKDEGMNIYFVPVATDFQGHEAFSYDPYINGIMPPQEQDLGGGVSGKLVSAYTMHPNENGAKVYAACVQKQINAIEKEEKEEKQGENDTGTVQDKIEDKIDEKINEQKQKVMDWLAKKIADELNKILDESCRSCGCS